MNYEDIISNEPEAEEAKSQVITQKEEIKEIIKHPESVVLSEFISDQE